MRLIKMNCNNCNAPLDIDLENLQAKCPYCGQKLMIDFDQLGRVLAEKEKTKRTLGKEEYQTKRAQMVYAYEAKEKDKEWKKKVIETIAVIAVCFFVFYYAPAHMFDSSKKKHNEKVAYLKQLEIEIDEAIQEDSYDIALLKANKLYCDDNWSKNETAAWDAKREAYLRLIDEKKREQDINNPDNIFMPSSSDSFNGKNYQDVVEQFESLGFTNINTQIASVKPGLFDKNDTVEHILIAGKTKFTAEDYFNKDSSITIYYYSK